MKKRGKGQGWVVLIVGFVLLGSWFLKSRLQEPARPQDSGPARRIISLAPSVTEVLFALGLGDRVVGRTDFCKYPPEAAEVASVGGYITPNYEAIVALKPDLVVLLPEHYEAKKPLAELGLSVLEVNHSSVTGILDSFTAIGERAGVEERAALLRTDITERLARVERLTRGLTRPKVLISFGRARNHGMLKKAHIPAKGTLFDELIVMAGGTNALKLEGVKYPLLSAEGIIRLDPDVIVDLSPGLDLKGSEKAGWMSVASVSAVKNDRVHILTADYLTIPGPRFVLLVEDLARLIHPGLR